MRQNVFLGATVRIRNDGKIDGRSTRHGPRLTADEFWALTTPIPETGCWILMTSSDANPYGSARVEGVREHAGHRIALSLATGRTLPLTHRFAVAHSCDVKGCVNPAHLALVSHRRNVKDAYARGLVRGRGMHRVAVTLAAAMFWRACASGGSR